MGKLFFAIVIILFLGFLFFRYILAPYAVKSHRKMIDFKTLAVPASPNAYLACPENYCQSKPNVTSPVFNISQAQLQKNWDTLISNQPRVKLLSRDDKSNLRLYVQYSKIWRFPDLIYVEIISLGEHKSTLAIYSRSIFGHYDFHVNKNRLTEWIRLLEKKDRSENN